MHANIFQFFDTKKYFNLNWNDSKQYIWMTSAPQVYTQCVLHMIFKRGKEILLQ